MFPSAGYSYIIPGAHVAPEVPAVKRLLPDADAVLRWEVDHGDMSFGGSYGSLNRNLSTIGYMYTQALDFDPGSTEFALRAACLDSNNEYEDIFLHFTEDTVFELPNPTHASDTSLAGLPWTMGYTASSDHAGFWVYQTPPWTSYGGGVGVPAWSGRASGGAFYVYQFERFDQLEFTLGVAGESGGSVLVEYPSSVGPSSAAAAGITVDRLATAWSNLTLLEDSTLGLTRNGTLRWQPPSDWLMASTHDGSGATYGGGPYMGTTALRDGGLAYVLRVSWLPPPSSAAADPTEPRLLDVKLRRWITEVAPGDPSVQTVPGWDAVNDADGDGYVSEAEFAARPNVRAAARFRHEARAVPLGRMWSASSSWCRVNPWNKVFQALLGAHLASSWAEIGQSGAYNDDLLKLLGASEYVLLSGGSLAELNTTTTAANNDTTANATAAAAVATTSVIPLKVNSTEAADRYTTAFAALLATVSAITRGVVTGNISGRNLFMSALTRPFLRHLNGFLREDYLTSGMGLTGYFGLQKAWDTFAMAHNGIFSMVQCQFKSARVTMYGKANASNYEADQQACLALYFLNHVPDMTFANFWGNNFWYGSQNTGYWNWFLSGVPMNFAYQPTEALRLSDLGVPTGRVPEGQEAMQYMVATEEPDLNGYTLIGTSNDTFLYHPQLTDEEDGGILPIIPSGIYYAQRAEDHPVVPGGPLEAVVARAFTKGLVLFRTDMFGGSQSWLESTPLLTVALNGTFRRVMLVMNTTLGRSDAFLGPRITHVALGAYEGAVLLRAEDEEEEKEQAATPPPTLAPADSAGDGVVALWVSGLVLSAAPSEVPGLQALAALHSLLAAQLRVPAANVVDLGAVATASDDAAAAAAATSPAEAEAEAEAETEAGDAASRKERRLRLSGGTRVSKRKTSSSSSSFSWDVSFAVHANGVAGSVGQWASSVSSSLGSSSFAQALAHTPFLNGTSVSVDSLSVSNASSPSLPPTLAPSALPPPSAAASTLGQGDEDDDDDDDDDSASGVGNLASASVVGLVVGAAVLAGVLAGAVWWWARKKRKSTARCGSEEKEEAAGGGGSGVAMQTSKNALEGVRVGGGGVEEGEDKRGTQRFGLPTESVPRSVTSVERSLTSSSQEVL